ncbi:hypothetical protein B0H17DRAFT_1173664 [Mycena rosella]|uniref:Uncharacterized protein n=1 Tax=Mycena rosella TaxID=1033263 RepID=A0AAD7H3I2_MYCRO|nr:hypothetical protein B0H17DRAFT_1173664 [Mycena rosella]
MAETPPSPTPTASPAPDTSVNDDTERPCYNISKKLKNKSDPRRILAVAIFKDIQQVHAPAVFQWEQDPTPVTRKEYVMSVIWPALDFKFAISGPDGFKVADFQMELKKHGLPDPIVDDTRKRTKNPRDIFVAEKHLEITKAAEPLLEGKDRTHNDGLGLKAFQETATKMFDSLDAKELAALGERAAKVNEDVPDDDIETNQSELSVVVQKALRKTMGDGPGKAGDVCFFVRYAFKRPSDGAVVYKRISVLKPSDKRRFANAQDEEGPEFKAWALSVLLSPEEVPLFVPQAPAVVLAPEQGAQNSAQAAETVAPVGDSETPDFSPALVKAATAQPPPRTSNGDGGAPPPRTPHGDGGAPASPLTPLPPGPPPAKKARGRPRKTASVVGQKRKAEDERVEGEPVAAAKRQKNPVAPRPRTTRATAGPRTPSPVPIQGRMINSFFYPIGAILPVDYAWEDEYKPVWRKSTALALYD